MKPPVTPKPMPASSPDLPTDHTSKFLGIVYITLSGVIDAIIQAAGLWSWVGNYMPLACKTSLQFPGLKPERDLTSGSLLSLDEQKLLASSPLTPKVPVNLTNESVGQAKDPEITWATAAGEAKKLPVEYEAPKDDQPCNPKWKFKPSQFKPANEISPAMDATKGCKTLIDSIIRPKGNCKSFFMADGHKNLLYFTKKQKVVLALLNRQLTFWITTSGLNILQGMSTLFQMP
ncbi:hypothetical protein DSO57_1000572 [Entomophthora muscae]|uniref:Uncharacterized protein n=1 Tax=Entomophthora muscae TaxID=34485 RepID=A0ACC2SB43_9FUNG|nr:hypothetical protein DSO57_1000572 [Entomophthora muscae]